MKKKMFYLLSLLMVAAMVLGACGTKEATEEEAPMADEGPWEAKYEVVNENCGESDVIKRIYAPDASTVVFELCNTNPALITKIGFVGFVISPSEYIEAQGGSGEMLDKFIGTGPYMVDEWKRGESLTMSNSMTTGARKPSTMVLSCAGPKKAPPACSNCRPVLPTGSPPRTWMTGKPS